MDVDQQLDGMMEYLNKILAPSKEAKEEFDKAQDEAIKNCEGHLFTEFEGKYHEQGYIYQCRYCPLARIYRNKIPKERIAQLLEYAERRSHTMQFKNLKTQKPFEGLFPIDPKIVKAIKDDMLENGYDQSQPIVVWKGKGIVVDGLTRLEAARQADLNQVSVNEKPFKSEEEALRYAIHNQRDRRNLTDADILRCIEAVDKRKKTGPKDLASTDAKPGKSAQETAKIIGTSQSKVERARTVLADEEAKKEVLEGKKSIHKAAVEIQEKKPQPDLHKKFNNTLNNLLGIIHKGKASIPQSISRNDVILGISRIRHEYMKQIDGTDDKVMMIGDMGQLMADTSAQLKEIKPLIKKYLKHPPKNKEKVKAFQFFIGWLQSWQKEAVSILTVEKEKVTNDPDLTR